MHVADSATGWALALFRALDVGPYTYACLHLVCLAAPLLLTFDPWVRFYRRLGWFMLALIFPAAYFILWDATFTTWGVWHFNYRYVTGPSLWSLPWEEWLFFFSVPYACIFLADTFEVWFPIRPRPRLGRVLFLLLYGFLLLLLPLSWGLLYTRYTLLGLLVWMPLSAWWIGLGWWPHILRTWLVCLIPFFLVNGVLTALPVVVYNDAENLGIRLITIPAEDTLYGFLLFLMTFTLYKVLLRRYSGRATVSRPAA